MKNTIQKCSLLILSLISCSVLYAKSFGSDRVASRQTTVFLPTADTNNALQGFASFEGGLALGSKNATATFDALFPLKGNVVLNGGTMMIASDVNIKLPIKIGTGTFASTTGNSMQFPLSSTPIQLPSQGFEKVLNELDSIATRMRGAAAGGAINSVDWSPDNQYVAIAVTAAPSVNVVQVYSFISNTLTLEASYNLGAYTANAIRWNPTSDYIAVGASGGAQLDVFFFDTGANTLSLVSTATPGVPVTALAWDPTGSYVAVGLDGVAAAVQVYPVDGVGNLGSPVSYTFPVTHTVQENALDFDAAGLYLAVGLDTVASNPELYALKYSGGTLTLEANATIGYTVSAVSWQPNVSNVAVGLAGGTQRLRLFALNTLAHTLVDQVSAYVDQTITLNEVQWDSTGQYLAAAGDYNAQGFELYIFLITQAPAYTFDLISGVELTDDALCVRWSPNGTYIALGDVNGELNIYNFTQLPLYFSDIHLIFNSAVEVRSPVYFQGNCTVTMNNNQITLDPTGSIIVDSGANLAVENAVVIGVGGTNIQCIDDTGVLNLRNIGLVLDSNLTFSMGAMRFAGNCSISGSGNTFAYQTAQTSTVVSNASLLLDTGITFSYDAIRSANPNLFTFVDSSAKLILNGASLYATTTGMQITNAAVQVQGDSWLYSEGITYNPGITFGDNTGNDATVAVYPGVDLTIVTGIMSNKNLNPIAITCLADTANIVVASDSQLSFYQTMNIISGFLTVYDRSILAFAPGAQFLGSLKPLGNYVITTL